MMATNAEDIKIIVEMSIRKSSVYFVVRFKIY